MTTWEDRRPSSPNEMSKEFMPAFLNCVTSLDVKICGRDAKMPLTCTHLQPLSLQRIVTQNCAHDCGQVTVTLSLHQLGANSHYKGSSYRVMSTKPPLSVIGTEMPANSGACGCKICTTISHDPVPVVRHALVACPSLRNGNTALPCTELMHLIVPPH